MQQTAQSAAPANSGGFASILAELSGPAQDGEPVWNNDGLEADFATLSYERALRTHALTRLAQGERSGGAEQAEMGAEPAAGTKTERAGVDGEESQNGRTALDRNLKRTSVTIRLSEAESAQLHRRAEEAGLTVSAYLRSCTFEAEALRAQVKEALADLRAAGSGPAESDSEAVVHPRLKQSWVRRLQRPFHFRREAANCRTESPD
jgi:hypothetical protein